MIINKKLGLKIAENPLEKLWEKIRMESEMLIEQSKNNLIIQEAMHKLSIDKLKEIGK